LSLALTTALLVVVQSVWANPGLEMLIRVTSASDGDRYSYKPSLNADGTVVAFCSDSDLLNEGKPDGQWKIWLYDTKTTTYTRVTSASHTNRDSWSPSLSADGTVVAFDSDSDLLSEGRSDDVNEIWLYDSATMTFTRITTASHSKRDSTEASLSADGTVIAFRSDSDFMGEGITDAQWEIWLYDTETLTYTRVTTASDSQRNSDDPNLSGDGTVIAFRSNSDLLNEGRPADVNEIWLYNTESLTYTRVTSASHTDRDSRWPSLNWDGTVVAFDSNSDFLDEGISDDVYEIWLYDTVAMTYTRITQASHPNRFSRHPSLSDDGTVVAFWSDSDLLYEGRPDDIYEIWLYDTATMTFTRVTSASHPNRDSFYPSLDSDGTVVAFSSDSDLLKQGISDDVDEIWLSAVYESSLRLPLVLKQYL
jgi:Tol biopolymer transport system component